MQKNLISLAEQIFDRGPGAVDANEEFKTAINNPLTVSENLSHLLSSEKFCFAYCSNMIRLIENGEFNFVSETRS